MVRRGFRSVLMVMLSLALMVSVTPLNGTVYAEDAPNKVIRLAVLSDIHYVNDANRSGAASKDLDNAAKSENRFMKEIDSILAKALADAGDTDPDAVLVSGDLASNGEYANEEGLAARLASAKDEDTGVYVVNGNHDMNNSYAADFTGSSVTAATRTQASDFKTIYKELGYGDNVRYYGGEAGSDVKNSGALSYATEIKDGVTLIALDTAMYNNNEEAQYNNAQLVAGEVSDGLLAWAKKEAETAKSKGNLVIAMCHHSLMPHQGIINEPTNMYFKDYIVANWEKVASTLADAGVSVALTGHAHSNDIAQYTSKAGNTIYDIETSALCAYPCGWRTLDIYADENGEYTFDVNSHFIDEVDGVDTGGKRFQAYSFEKTGLPEDGVVNLLGYLVREWLYGVKDQEGGLAAYLKEQLAIEDPDQSVGEYGKEEILKILDNWEPQEQEFDLFGAEYVLTIEPVKEDAGEGIRKFDLKLKYETANDTDVTIKLSELPEEMQGKLDKIEEEDQATGKNLVDIEKDATVDGEPAWHIIMHKGFPKAVKAQLMAIAGIDPEEEVTERGTLILDLSYLDKGIDNAIDTADGIIQDETEDHYGRSELQDEILNAAETSVMPALTEPLNETDAQSTPLFIARDALQAYARGDEESFVLTDVYGSMTAEELKTKRSDWNELIRGDAFDNRLKDTVMNAVSDIATSYDYPKINSILTTKLVEGDGKLATIESNGSTLTFLDFILGMIKTPKDILEVASIMDGFGVTPINGAQFHVVSDMFAQAQESLTVDNNIKHDSKWSFHTVALDAQGGKASTARITTVEGNKAGSLPTPTYGKNKFLGWYTKPSGGDKITKDTDLGKIYKVYAHWQASGTDPNQKGTDGTAVGPGASAACAEKAITGMKTDADPKGSVYGKVRLRSSKQGKTYETIQWTKVSGAKKYVLYGNKCGKSNKMKKIGTYTGSSKKVTKVAGKKVKKGTYYKYIVVALDKDNCVVSTSKVIHVATTGGKVTNPKKVAVKRGKKSVSKVAVKKGKTVTVKSKVSKVSKKKALKKHRVVKYESSNKKIATVTSAGKIKGIKKGTAYVYAYAQNGVAKKIKVTVK